jgi:hypothetical protein
MTEAFEFSEQKRENLVYHFATMDESEATQHTENWKKWEVEASAQRAKQASERAAKTAAEGNTPAPPSGTALKPPPWAKPSQ